MEFELRRIEHFATRAAARAGVAAWIEDYNHHRRDSGILGLSRSVIASKRWPAISPGAGRDGTTAAAWAPLSPPTGTAPAPAATQRHVPLGRQVSAPGWAVEGGWRLNLAPTPELLARVHASPSGVSDFPEVDLGKESAQDRRFNRLPLLNEFRRPLLAGLVLVVLDGLAALAGPVLVKQGLDGGVADGSLSVLLIVSGIYLFVVLADLVVEIGETFVTGRAAQRIMLSLRIRIWAQLQRLSLDYYEREMAGRIMTRMTTDVDQFESLIQNGLLSALVAMVTFLGVGIALAVIATRYWPRTLTVVSAPIDRDDRLSPEGGSLVRPVPRTDRHRQRRFPGELVGRARVPGFCPRKAHRRTLPRPGPRLPGIVGRRTAFGGHVFPVWCRFLSGVADAIVLGVGAGLVARGQLTSGALIAFILYIDLFFFTHPATVPLIDSWQQTRVSVRRIGQLMQLERLPRRPQTRPNQAA